MTPLACGSDSDGSGPNDERDAGDVPPNRDGGVSAEDGGPNPTADAGARDSGPTTNPGPIEGLSDEFDSAASRADWNFLNETTLASTVDFDTSNPGTLTVVPRQGGWFEDDQGPFVYKMVTGDFVVQTHVNARNTSNRNAAPTQGFNSAGLMARDPASVQGGENWVMYNLGYQESGVAAEGKSTRDSVSWLFFEPAPHVGTLVLCRLGGTFHMWLKLDGETSWTETHRFTLGDSNRPAPTMPDTLQVGVIANGFNGPPDITAEFDYVRFAVPNSLADCTADLRAN